MSANAGACEQECGTCAEPECGDRKEEERLQRSLGAIRRKIVVLSGKGGVGKSTVAANLAVALSLAGRRVGLLDVDAHGPSQPRLLSLTGQAPRLGAGFMEPVTWSQSLRVMSLGFMLPKDEAVIWRGPMKMGLIKQFLQDVAWGPLDDLVVDCPPGTGDEPLTVMQLLGQSALALIVTTPQAVAVDDVRRSVTFCRELGNPILGVVENMSGFTCPGCGRTHDVFSAGGGEAMAREMGVAFLGRIPLDPEAARSGDEGYALAKVGQEGSAGRAFQDVMARIDARCVAMTGEGALAGKLEGAS